MGRWKDLNVSINLNITWLVGFVMLLVGFLRRDPWVFAFGAVLMLTPPNN